jgi:hypothetical protein
MDRAAHGYPAACTVPRRYAAAGEFVRAPLRPTAEGTSRFLVKLQLERIPVLVGIKLLHTAVWLFFAGCIVAIPLAGARHQFRWAAVLTGLVLVECAVLAVNRGRCPLTDLAGRYTRARTENFDIYLPLWLARHNKTIFGTLFVAGELFLLGQWLISCR